MTRKSTRTLAKEVFEGIKKRTYFKYNAEAHCVGILEVLMGENPSTSQFCKKYNVPTSTLHKWIYTRATFGLCYAVGLEYAHANWMDEYENNKDCAEFNDSYWRQRGKILFQLGENRRLKLHVKKSDTPYEQYKTIMEAASRGEYTATELKQIMESVMVGARAFESDELAKRVNEMELDIEKGRQSSEQNQSEIEESTKED